MKCICENEMDSIIIGNKIVYYCDNCMTFEYEEFECDHKNNHPIVLIMSDGRKMIKNYCQDCEHTYGSPISQKGFDIEKMHKTTNESYLSYREQKDIIQHKNYLELTKDRQSLRSIKNKSGYTDYLNSSEWIEKRNNILKRDNSICQICGDVAECVHHLTYAHLRNEYFFELISLCKKCHVEHYHPEKKHILN